MFSLRIAVLLMLVSLVAARVVADIEAGERTATLVWTKEHSPYRITGMYVVPAGERLVIEPGVDVLFDADERFIVQGNLYALGTATDSVRFLPGNVSEWGGIHFADADTSFLQYVRISGGRADAPSLEYGGGIVARGERTHLGLAHAVIEENAALLGGGGIFATDGARVFLSESLITRNRAAKGGGIRVADDAQVVLTRCVLTENAGEDREGGAIFAERAGQIVLENCTVVDNEAEYGAGMFVDSKAVVQVRNTIMWQNVFHEFYSAPLGGASISARYSDILGGWSGEGNIDADPLFVNSAEGDFRLQPGSPCIDAGDPAGPPDPDGTRADIGAYPYDPFVAAARDGRRASLRVQGFPNPFNAAATIRIVVPEAGHVRLAVYDAGGRHVRTLFEGWMPSGARTFRWDGTNSDGQPAASGAYFLMLTTKRGTTTQRVALVR